METKKNSSNIPVEPKKPAPIKTRLNLEKALRPKTVTDLGVHSKKIKDVQKWLEDFVLQDKKVCFQI